MRQRPAVSAFALIAIGLIMTAVIAIAYFGSIPIAGAIYVSFFILLTATTPSYAYMLIFAAAPFAWDVGGGPVNMAVSEISLVLALPIVLIRTPPQGWARLRNPLWLPIIAYFLVCVFSTIANTSFRAGITSIIQMAVYLVVCLLVFSVAVPSYQSILPAFYGLLGTMCVLSLMVIGSGNAFILGLHKNLVGTELMYAVIIAFELWLAKAVRKEPRKLAVFVLTVLICGLVVSRSRGAWMGTFVGIMFILMLRRQFTLAIRTFFFLVPLLVIAWLFLLNDDAREYASTFNTEDQFGSITTRLRSIDFAIAMFKQNPAYGVGVGLRKFYDATNVVLSTLAETGVAGLIAFLSIFLTLLAMAWSAQKRIARTDPIFSFLVIGVAIMFGKLCHGLVDHYWSRGIIPVWAGAGLASYAYSYAQRNNPKRALERRRKAWRRAGLQGDSLPVVVTQVRPEPGPPMPPFGQSLR